MSQTPAHVRLFYLTRTLVPRHSIALSINKITNESFARPYRINIITKVNWSTIQFYKYKYLPSWLHGHNMSNLRSIRIVFYSMHELRTVHLLSVDVNHLTT